MKMTVTRKRDGKQLGVCEVPFVGRVLSIPYKCRNSPFTTMYYRWGISKNGSVRVIAHGMRDAKMLPNFKPSM